MCARLVRVRAKKRIQIVSGIDMLSVMASRKMGWRSFLTRRRGRREGKKRTGRCWDWGSRHDHHIWSFPFRVFRFRCIISHLSALYSAWPLGQLLLTRHCTQYMPCQCLCTRLCACSTFHPRYGSPHIEHAWIACLGREIYLSPTIPTWLDGSTGTWCGEENRRD
ncbi:hypothetical protein B0H66DRAFT_271665 [Apodospora peruviana]|uniref:Uncharacterized protein n=1 Tax=Apodospora peruviana TaxID=516989 RepID=A0AAE0HZT5_9PEZI|nr:hypothetical protein B0H66DRAFT_271665 [Apodospora peruviana]